MPDTSSWLFGETSIDDLMADPIVQLVMRSDQVSAEELWALIRTASARLTPAPENTTDAQTDAQNPFNPEPESCLGLANP